MRHSVKAKMAYGKQIMRGRKRAPVHTFPVIRVATPKKDSQWIKSYFVHKLHAQLLVYEILIWKHAATEQFVNR